jgi:hypothetical protein
VKIAALSCIISVLAFSGCATTSEKSSSKKHSFTDTSALVLGKTTPDECRALYGEPQAKSSQTGGDGAFELYRYTQVVRGPTKGFARALLAEFKDGVLNAYASGSSFPEDRATFSVANISKIEYATSTKDQVRSVLGKPHGILRCPTKLFGGSTACKPSSREIWVYEDYRSVNLSAPHTRQMFTGAVVRIVFDEHNLVTDITSSENNGL